MRKIQNNVVAGIDIGTTKIAIAVGQFQEGVTQIIALASVPNGGLRKGMIEDISSVSSSIYKALCQVEEKIGMPIDEIVVGINGHHCSIMTSKGVIAVSRADGQISANDAERVIEAAKTISLPPNREIIHVLPKRFIIDSQEDVKDPVGMNGIRLEVEAHLVGGSTPALRNLEKCLVQAEIPNATYVFNPLATAKAMLDKKQKDLGVTLVDIGAVTTGMVVYEEGDLIHAAVLPVGSMHITNDIAIGLRIPIDVAEQIKLKYACADPSLTRDGDSINLQEFGESETERISRKYLAEIIEARVMEIFSLIKEELQSAGKDGTLPAGIVYTGCGSQLDGLIDVSKKQLRLPSQFARPLIELSSSFDNAENPMYSTSIGLMMWGLENFQGKKYTYIDGNVGAIFDKAKNIFKQFMP